MSEIQRYLSPTELDPGERGMYVLYADHAAALSARDAEVGRLKEAAAKIARRRQRAARRAAP